MKQILINTLLIIGLGAWVLPANAAYEVQSPGPLNSFSIVTNINNTGPYGIASIEFDLSGTTTTDGSHLVIDPPPFSVSNGTSGAASFFNLTPETFGYNFSNFDVGDAFSFAWDPDSALNVSYGAIISELAGTAVTLGLVGAADLYGVMQVVGTNVEVVWSSVPESSTIMLLAIGLLGLSLSRRKIS